MIEPSQRDVMEGGATAAVSERMVIPDSGHVRRAAGEEHRELETAAHVLTSVQSWLVEMLPPGDVGAQTEIIIWLILGNESGKLLKDLYACCRHGEKALRRCLQRLAADGLVEISSDAWDGRQRRARPTAKLKKLIKTFESKLCLTAPLPLSARSFTGSTNVKCRSGRGAQ